MAIETKQAAEVYDLRTPYLEQGRTTDVRARTDLMTVTVKVYAEGGENAMHNHPTEDHSFIVLEGEATFFLESDDNPRVVRRYEGVMLPKGANYWFKSTGEGNLVMVRVGASIPGAARGRLTPEGRDIPGDSVENKTVERIERPGPGFGA
ncbi:MAG TPA: cupin domain-containing protein [Chloroflexota bacterium]|nr:cupin domain-containing protein [Chloroflexota bacterium]